MNADRQKTLATLLFYRRSSAFIGGHQCFWVLIRNAGLDGDAGGAARGDQAGRYGDQSEMANAGAYIKDALAGLRCEEHYQSSAKFPYKRVRGIVESGIPIDLTLRASKRPDILVSWEG